MKELIRSALDPVIAGAIARGRTTEQRRANLLALTVCDPACGSGHFLLAAARRISRELARNDAAGNEPGPLAETHAIREVIAHCLYGVDLNPLAVDLCKTALWLEGQEPGRPLTFLDHHIRHGNALVGTFGDVMTNGIPDDAFEPVTGDDKAIATATRKRNRHLRRGNVELAWNVTVLEDEDAARRFFADLAAPDDTLATVRRKERLYAVRQESPDQRRRRAERDLWCAAFFWPLRRGTPPPPTQTVWRRISDDPRLPAYLTGDQDAGDDADTAWLGHQIGREQAFFHWDLEFAEVFGPGGTGGFSCVLGNPPWERVKLQEQEFFAQRDPAIATAANAAARKRLIATLPERNPGLAADFNVAKQASENQSQFLRTSGRFEKTGRGDVNTYSVFAELAARTIGERGQSGIIVPTGIATDDTNKHFFAWLVDTSRLTSLIDFENREAIFPGVHRSYKFSLLGMTGRDRELAPFAAAFFLGNPDEARDPRRVFALSAEDIRLFNPNTRTCPIFRGARDAAVTRTLYEAAPVLVREGQNGDPDDNPWGISFQRMFDMSNDSHLFRTRAELEDDGWTLSGDGRFVRETPPPGPSIDPTAPAYLPLYEAKLIHQYDHRFATFAGQGTGAATDEDKARDTTLAEHQDPEYVVTPRYWVPEGEVYQNATGPVFGRSWFISYRDIARNTDERDVYYCLYPALRHRQSLVRSRHRQSSSASMSAVQFGLNRI